MLKLNKAHPRVGLESGVDVEPRGSPVVRKRDLEGNMGWIMGP